MAPDRLAGYRLRDAASGAGESDTGRPGYRLRRGVTTVLGLFGRQDAVYRAATLGSGARIAVEVACRMGWDAYLGTCGGFIGMSGFGASGPADALYEKFGITVLRSWRRQSVCSHIRAASWRAAIDCWPQGAPYGSSHTVSRA